MHVHLIAYDLSIPPLHGAGIDTYYLLQSLAEAGVQVHLHVFVQDQLPEADLMPFATELRVYPTRSLGRSLPLRYPHAVSSRNHDDLLHRLLQDDLPIIFGGLPTTYFLSHPEFARRIKVVRLHEVAWMYHEQLAARETRYWQRQYLQAEARQLRRFESILEHADYLLPVSQPDVEYYGEWHDQVHWIPPFHPFSRVTGASGRGEYCLYHGHLGQAEQHMAAMFLVEQVFDQVQIPLVVAGPSPQADLISAISDRDHILLRPNPGRGEMAEMLHQAHIHVLPAFDQHGLSLQLLYSLYNGRFVVVNPVMVGESPLAFGTHIAHTPEDMQRLIVDLWHQPFSEIDLAQRKAALNGSFANAPKVQRLLHLIQTGTP